MSLATVAEIRKHGNLTDVIDDTTQITPQIAVATHQLQAYLGLSVYEGIVQRDHAAFTAYTSDFSADADDWEQNAGDADLQVTGNNDSILGRDNCLKVYANAADLDFRIKNDVVTPAGGKAYRIRFDYYAEEDCGINYLGMEVSASERARNPYGDYLGVPVVEEVWNIGQVMRFLGFGNLTLTGYISPGGQYEADTMAQLAEGKAIHFTNIYTEYLNDLAILTIAENKWALGLLMEPLAIHCAGDGLAFMGGIGDGRYQYIDPATAARMGRRYIAAAKSLVAPFVPRLDTVGDGRNQVFAAGNVDMVAV